MLTVFGITKFSFTYRRCQKFYLNVFHFFNTSVNQTSVAALDNCFPAYVSYTCCSIATFIFTLVVYSIFFVKMLVRLTSSQSLVMCSCWLLEHRSNGTTRIDTNAGKQLS